MAPCSVLSLSSVLLQLVGVAVTAFGAWKMWQQFASEELWAPIAQGVARAWRRIQSLAVRAYRRITRKRQHARVLADVATARSEARAGKVRGRQQFPPIADDVEPRIAIAELEERTRRLMTKMNDLKEALEDERSERRDEDGKIRAALVKEISRLDLQDRDVAIGGIRIEALGLFLIAAGLGVQALAMIIC